MSLRYSVLTGLCCLIAGGAVAADYHVSPTAGQDQSPAPTVGLVSQVEFKGALGRLDKNERQLLYTLPVYTNELIHTGKDSSTALQFLDKTRLQVGANSDVVLDRYVYDPASGVGSVAINFSSGIFRFVTGEMKNKAGFDLKTPSGVMAIRGTKVIIYVDDKGNSIAYFERGEGTWLSCNGSQTDVHTSQSVVAPVDCSKVNVVNGNLTPPDPAVVADLPVSTDLVDLLNSFEPGSGPNGPPPSEHDYKDNASPR